VATFLTFSAVVFGSFVFGAVTLASMAAATVCVAAGSFLLFVLGLVLGVSIFVTCTYVSTTLGLRLAFHLFNKEGKGLMAWFTETLAFFGLTPPPSDKTFPKEGGIQHIAGEDYIDSLPSKKDMKVEEGSDDWSSVERHVGDGAPLAPEALKTPPIEGPYPEGPIL